MIQADDPRVGRLRVRLGAGFDHAVQRVSMAQSGFREQELNKVELIADVQDIFEAATKLYRFTLPREVILKVGDDEERRPLQQDLDDEGRPVYQGLHWLSASDSREQEGQWSAEFGQRSFRLLGCALPWDHGTWRDSETMRGHDGVSCTWSERPTLVRRELEALRSCFALGGSYGSVTFALRKVLERSDLGAATVQGGGTFLEALQALLGGMCSALRNPCMGVPGPELARVRDPAEATWREVFASLRSIAAFSDRGIATRLEQALPRGREFPQSAVRCMIYNCRLLDLCDIRSVRESGLLRLFHQVFLRRWQAEHGSDVRFVDLAERTCAVRHPPRRESGRVRFVVVSDTHGWDPEIMLPDGDVLLHCGDLLFEGCGCRGKAAPGDLIRALRNFHSPVYQRYHWIFVTGGNHDRSLHEIWASNYQWLCEQLPPNVVLLEAAAQLMDPWLEETCAAKERHVVNLVDRGAVKLRPNMELCPASSERNGWTIAGSGVSVAHTYWSANRAFQLQDEDSRARAAVRLLHHHPQIVMTHGPPQGHGDADGRGDRILRERLDASDVLVHVFGHQHAESEPAFIDLGGRGARCSINAAMSTTLYVAAREPLVFDLAPDSGAVPVRQPLGDPGVGLSEMEAALPDDYWDPFEDPAEEHRRSQPRRPQPPASAPTAPATPHQPLLEAAQQEEGRPVPARECLSWLPAWAVHRLVREMLEEVGEVRGERRRLTMFDVAGPAVKWALVSLVFWAFSIAFPWIGLHYSSCRSEQLLADYPWWLWPVAFVPFLPIFLLVEWMCMSLVSVVQVQWVGRFRLFGVWEWIQFEHWLLVQFLLSILNRVDIAASSLFMAKVLKSSHCGSAGDIMRVWERREPLPLETAFLAWYLLRLTQFLYTLLRVVPVQSYVSYGFRSMHKGYRVPLTYVFNPHFYTGGMFGKPMDRLLVWHADVLETLAIYGGLVAVTNQSLMMTLKRAESELDRNKCGYLHILHMKLRHLVARFLLLHLLDKLVKLYLQVAVLSAEADLLRERGETGALELLETDWQLPLALFTSFLTTFIGLLQELLNFRKMSAAINRVSSGDYEPRSSSFALEEQVRVSHNLQTLFWIMRVYSMLLLLQLGGLVHVAVLLHTALSSLSAPSLQTAPSR